LINGTVSKKKIAPNPAMTPNPASVGDAFMIRVIVKFPIRSEGLKGEEGGLGVDGILWFVGADGGEGECKKWRWVVDERSWKRAGRGNK